MNVDNQLNNTSTITRTYNNIQQMHNNKKKFLKNLTSSAVFLG